MLATLCDAAPLARACVDGDRRKNAGPLDDGARTELAGEGVTLSALRQIESLGYTVIVHQIPSSLLGRVGAFVEMHAVDLRTEPSVQQLARVRCR